MKIDKKKLLWGTIFVIGLAIFLYPIVSDIWNQRRADQLVVEYKENIKKENQKNFEDEKKKVRQYNSKLIGEDVPAVFAVRENKKDSEYESLLNNGDGMMGYVEIPSINVHLPIYHYTSEEVLQKNVGHLFGSSLPLGGKGTHVAISAHRGLPSAKLFTDLNLLEKGDYFFLHILDETLAYEVDQILEVKPNETGSLVIDPNEDYVTLFTCTPYGVNTHRLLVRGHRKIISSETEVEEIIQNVDPKTNSMHLISQIGVMILGVVIALITINSVERLMNRKRKLEK